MQASGSTAKRSNVKRSCPKLVRFTSDELTVVTERARASGRPVACYIREASLGTTPRARRTPASDDLIRRLARLGNQLTALARAAREQQLAGADEFEGSLTDLLEVIRQID